MHCDFCNQEIEEQDCVIYRARPIVMVDSLGRGHVLDGEWAACGKCHKMLKEGRWNELAEYIASRFSDVTGIRIEDARESAKHALEVFRRAMLIIH